MLTTLLFTILTSHAITCTKVLSSNDLVVAMNQELSRLEQQASRLTPKQLASEMNAIQGVSFVDVMGVEMIPYSVELLSKKLPFSYDKYSGFVEAWNDQVWTYVVIKEFRRRTHLSR